MEQVLLREKTKKSRNALWRHVCGRPPIVMRTRHSTAPSVQSGRRASRQLQVNMYARYASLLECFWRPVTLVFDLLTENWHTGYPCPSEHWDNGVSLRFFVFELGACIHATDGKTRNMAY